MGYLITGIKDAREVKVGDTITDFKLPTDKAISGFEDVKPMVFAGIYPVDTEDYGRIKSLYGKASSLMMPRWYFRESSAALGLVSVVVSWVCCILKLFRSVWNVNLT